MTEEISYILRGFGAFIILWQVVKGYNEGVTSKEKPPEQEPGEDVPEISFTPVASNFSFFSNRNDARASLIFYYLEELNLEFSLPINDKMVRQRARDMMVDLLKKNPETTEAQYRILAAKEHLCNALEWMTSEN
jgi:hypothetical protein